METNDRMIAAWVDRQLAALAPPAQWQPDLHGALARFRRQRPRPGASRRRWTWTAAAVLTAALVLLAFPAPRAAAQRLWAPCVEACSLLLRKVDAVRPR